MANSAVRAVTHGRLLWIRDNCPGAARHRSIRMRNDRHDCYSSGECEDQREDSSYLFHDRLPLHRTQF